MTPVLETLLQIAQIASLVVGLAGSVGVWKYVKWRRKVKKTAVQMIRDTIDALQATVDGSEATDYVTLECHTDHGIIEIPVFKDRWEEVPPGGVSMMLMSRTPERTVCALRCPMAQTIPTHHHMRIERIYVMSGLLDELSSDGNVVHTYHPGETWEIKPEEKHAGTFRNCLCNMTYIPTLPTGAEKPANLKLALAALEQLA